MRRAAAAARRLAIAVAIAATTATAARGEDVVVGMSAAFSGPSKELALQLRTGIEVALAAANASGGIRGRRVRLATFDDRGAPATAQAGLAELADRQRVVALLGTGSPATADALVSFVNQRHLPLLGSLAPAGALWNDPPDRYVFNYRPSWREEAAALVRHLVEVRRIDPARLAVLAEEGAGGDAAYEAVAQALRRLRPAASPALRLGYRSNTAEVDLAVQAVRRSAPKLQAIVVAGAYLPAARFIEKLRDARLDLVIAVGSHVGSSELAEELSQLGPTYAEGILVTQVVPNPNGNASALLAYREQLRHFAPGERPGFLSLEGWLLGRLFLEALAHAPQPVTSEGLVDALESLRGVDLGTGASVALGPSEHQASHKIWGTKLDGRGQFSPLELQ